MMFHWNLQRRGSATRAPIPTLVRSRRCRFWRGQIDRGPADPWRTDRLSDPLIGTSAPSGTSGGVVPAGGGSDAGIVASMTVHGGSPGSIGLSVVTSIRRSLGIDRGAMTTCGSVELSRISGFAAAGVGGEIATRRDRTSSAANTAAAKMASVRFIAVLTRTGTRGRGSCSRRTGSSAGTTETSVSLRWR